MPHLREMTDEEQRAIATRLRELADAVEQEKPLSWEINAVVSGAGFDSVEIQIGWLS
jgi:hypothetical protein